PQMKPRAVTRDADIDRTAMGRVPGLDRRRLAPPRRLRLEARKADRKFVWLGHQSQSRSCVSHVSQSTGFRCCMCPWGMQTGRPPRYKQRPKICRYDAATNGKTGRPMNKSGGAEAATQIRTSDAVSQAEAVAAEFARARDAIGRVVFGQQEVVDQVL